MQQIVSQHAVLVTASAGGDDVRRELLERGIAIAGVSATLARLRRALVRGGDATPIVLCITLDEPTLRRHGASLARLLDDRMAFVTPVSAIGLMIDCRLASGWAGLGCDAIAKNVDHLISLLECFQAQSLAQVGGRFAEQDSLLSLPPLDRMSDVDSDQPDALFPPRVKTRRTDFPRPQS